LDEETFGVVFMGKRILPRRMIFTPLSLLFDKQER
jgi:hypothetical protein